jgi:hypothetical protein
MNAKEKEQDVITKTTTKPINEALNTLPGPKNKVDLFQLSSNLNINVVNNSKLNHYKILYI